MDPKASVLPTTSQIPTMNEEALGYVVGAANQADLSLTVTFGLMRNGKMKTKSHDLLLR